MALLRSSCRIQNHLAARSAALVHTRLFAEAASAAGLPGEASTSRGTLAAEAPAQGGAAALAEGAAGPGLSSAAAAAGTQEQRGPVSWPIRLTGLSQITMRRDVARLFAGFNINEYNIKPEYHQQSLYTKAFWALFETEEEQQRALALHKYYVGAHQVFMTVKSRHYMHQVLHCPLAMNSRGRYLLVDNIEGQNSLTTILRHFEGFLLAPHGATLVMPEGKQGNEYEAAKPLGLRTDMVGKKPPMRAVVRFQSVEEAHRALRARNHTYLGNDVVSLRVLP